MNLLLFPAAQHSASSSNLIASRVLRRCMYFMSAFTCYLFISSSFLQAQHSEDSLQVDLDPIEVTALRSSISTADAPLSLSISRRDLQSVNHAASLSLKSIGDELPGLWIGDRQNYALGERMTVRGLGWRAEYGVRGIQVVLNGVPLTIADG